MVVDDNPEDRRLSQLAGKFQITQEEIRFLEQRRAEHAAQAARYPPRVPVTQVIDPMINTVVVAWLRDVREEFFHLGWTVDDKELFDGVRMILNRRIESLDPNSPEAQTPDGEEAAQGDSGSAS